MTACLTAVTGRRYLDGGDDFPATLKVPSLLVSFQKHAFVTAQHFLFPAFLLGSGGNGHILFSQELQAVSNRFYCMFIAFNCIPNIAKRLRDYFCIFPQFSPSLLTTKSSRQADHHVLHWSEFSISVTADEFNH